MKGLNVVIIEDERSHFDLIKRTLGNYFHDISVHHFEEAGAFLESFDEIKPDIIITDFIMPDMDGIELLEILNNDGSDIPVIMVTGQGDETVAVRAMKLGVKDYLVKSDSFFNILPSIVEKVAIEQDFTKKLQESEKALHESEEKFKTIFEESPIGIILFDAQGRLVVANQSYLDIFGISDLSLVKGMNLFDSPNFSGDAMTELHKNGALRSEMRYDFEKLKKSKYFETEKSGHIYIDILLNLLGDKGEKSFKGYMVQIQDITKRKRAEASMRELSQKLISVQEEERRRISSDLHDNLAQDLSTLKIGLETLFYDWPDAPDMLLQKTSNLSGMVNKTITQIREIAYGLRPPGLDQLGLVQTIRRYCEEFSEKNRIKVDFVSAGMEELALDFGMEISLYRFAKEALNNIKKHANASQVNIRLVASHPNIILRIKDNGKGFNARERFVEAISEKRMGLWSMEKRIDFLDGKMEVESEPSWGTQIVIEIPLKEDKNG
ncbi:MAG: response regulator [Deltaproteobacteria bacterium]|nr:response regulator [Deltaproteobacteria bacterium]